MGGSSEFTLLWQYAVQRVVAECAIVGPSDKSAAVLLVETDRWLRAHHGAGQQISETVRLLAQIVLNELHCLLNSPSFQVRMNLAELLDVLRDTVEDCGALDKLESALMQDSRARVRYYLGKLGKTGDGKQGTVNRGPVNRGRRNQGTAQPGAQPGDSHLLFRGKPLYFPTRRVFSRAGNSHYASYRRRMITSNFKKHAADSGRAQSSYLNDTLTLAR